MQWSKVVVEIVGAHLRTLASTENVKTKTPPSPSLSVTTTTPTQLMAIGGQFNSKLNLDDRVQRPIWLRIPWPVSNSVPKPITKPIIARRPFQVSAKLLKPNRDWVESVMSLIEWWSPTRWGFDLLWSAGYSRNAVRSFWRASGHWIELAWFQCFGADVHLAVSISISF